MDNIVMRLLNPALIWVLIPISWIFLATIVEVIKLAQRHRERMAMINQGMHPDLEDQGATPDEDPFSAPFPSEDAGSHETMDYQAAR